MTPIVQEHPYGCGIAAVAQILGRSYRDTLPLFGADAEHKARTFGFYLHELCAALRRGGWRSYWIEVQPDSPSWHRARAIVFLGASAQYPAGHYLSRRLGGGWSNSWANFPAEQAQAAWQAKLPATPAFLLLNRDPIP